MPLSTIHSMYIYRVILCRVLPVHSASSPVIFLPLKGPFIPSEKNGDKDTEILFLYIDI